MSAQAASSSSIEFVHTLTTAKARVAGQGAGDAGASGRPRRPARGWAHLLELTSSCARVVTRILGGVCNKQVDQPELLSLDTLTSCRQPSQSTKKRRTRESTEPQKGFFARSFFLRFLRFSPPHFSLGSGSKFCCEDSKSSTNLFDYVMLYTKLWPNESLKNIGHIITFSARVRVQPRLQAP